MTTPLRLDAASTCSEPSLSADDSFVPPSVPPSSARAEATKRLLLRVSAGAEWFELGDRDRVVLETRIPLRRLLLALARMRASSPTSVLPVPAAFEAGWPGERATPTAAAMRVYTAVHTLRRLGLRGVLVRRRRGYVLDCDVEIVAPNEERTSQAAAETGGELTVPPA